MKKLILLLLFFSYTSSSQTWKYSSTNDPFDGKTIYVTAKGYGGEFPYNSPDFYIRYRVKSDNLEMFISGLGYSGCDNNIIRIAYDDNPNKVVEYSVSESVDRDAIFFRSVNFNDILDNLKSSSKITIRFINECDINTFKYKLDGSSSAINNLVNQTKRYNPSARKKQAERAKQIRAEEQRREAQRKTIANQKNDKVEEAKKRLKDSMISRDIPPSAIKKYDVLLTKKLNSLYDINPDLNDVADIEIRLHFEPMLKKLGKYRAYIKFLDGKLSIIGTSSVHFNKYSDELMFEKRKNKFIDDLKYLKLKEYKFKSIDLSLNAEARRIFGEKIYDSIMVVKPNTKQDRDDFDNEGRVKLYFVNSKNITEKSFIYGDYFLEFDSPAFNEINNDLKVLKNLLSPFVARFERKELLKLRKGLYALGVGINNIKEFELLKKRGDLVKSMYQKGFRQLKVITNNDKELTLMRYIDTVNKKLL